MYGIDPETELLRKENCERFVALILRTPIKNRVPLFYNIAHRTGLERELPAAFTMEKLFESFLEDNIWAEYWARRFSDNTASHSREKEFKVAIDFFDTAT